MALIGPRPTVQEQVNEYTPFQRRRLEVLPGMTGWAQVNGGVELTWEQRMFLDVWYIDHRSFWLDVQILWRTLKVIWSGSSPQLSALEVASRYANCQNEKGKQSGFSPVAVEGEANLDVP
jgi:hypothetical protein